MASKNESSPFIRELQLCLGDKEFFYLFNNLSVFNQNPLQRQMNMIASITNVHKLLRYAQDPRFYKVCKAPELLSHWEKLTSKKSDLHPFDELLRDHCEEMKQHAESENNQVLADEFQRFAWKYSEAEISNQKPAASPI